jgi:hypothetical protein
VGRRRPGFEAVTETMTRPDGLSLRDRLAFHAFNPAGVLKRLQAVQAEVDALVDAHPGKIKNGVLWVHGSLSKFTWNRFMEMLNKKRVGNTELFVAVKMAEDEIKAAREWLAQKNAEVV